MIDNEKEKDLVGFCLEDDTERRENKKTIKITIKMFKDKRQYTRGIYIPQK